MKVVIYSRFSPQLTGGVERFVGSLQEALLHRGHACDVVAGPDLGCTPDTATSEAAQAIADHWARHRDVYDIAVFNKCEFAYKAQGGRTVLVVHGTSRGQYVACWRIRRLRSTLAGFVLSGHSQRRAGRRHTVVAVSKSTQRELRWLYGVRGAHVIQNAVDTDRCAPGDRQAAREQLGLPVDCRVYLYAARVEALKCPWFVPHWAKSLTPQEHLLVATDKPLDAAGRVTQLLNVPNETMPLLYRAADAFLMPSYYEGCAYAVIEAMSCACLLVASPVGHASDIMKADPLLAECFEPRRNAQAFLDRARRLLDDAALAARLREHERRYVLENNTLEKMGREYESLFERILRESGHLTRSFSESNREACRG